MAATADKKRHHFFQGFVLHLHPKKVAVETLRFNLSFGLGGMGAVLLLLLLVTGILQLLSYSPDILTAYDSVKNMYGDGALSGWVRNIHFWSGNLLVIVVLLHCCRVFLTGAIGAQRGNNWYIGLILFGLVLFANFSGYLLPWDQLAYWAVTIFTNMLGYIPFIGEDIVHLLRGGNEIGPDTLSIFYALHTGVLPFFFAVVLVYHFWLVRKTGGLVRRSVGNKENSPVFVQVIPNLIVREASVGLSLAAAVLVFAAFIDAPLAEVANPGMSPNPAKAAWFFLGFQELLMHLHPTYAICVLPVLFLLTLLVLPYWKDGVLPPGIWFGGEGGAKIALWASLAGISLTSGLIVLDEKLKNINLETATDWISRGIIPTCGLVLFYIAGYFVLRRMLKYSRAQTIMAGFIFTLMSVICLTLIGVWFRGPGMQLILLS